MWTPTNSQLLINGSFPLQPRKFNHTWAHSRAHTTLQHASYTPGKVATPDQGLHSDPTRARIPQHSGAYWPPLLYSTSLISANHSMSRQTPRTWTSAQSSTNKLGTTRQRDRPRGTSHSWRDIFKIRNVAIQRHKRNCWESSSLSLGPPIHLVHGPPRAHIPPLPEEPQFNDDRLARNHSGVRLQSGMQTRHHEHHPRPPLTPIPSIGQQSL